MIQLTKSPIPPVVLTVEGILERNTLHDLYNDGERIFNFKDTIYKHSDVVELLQLDQHQKCCFCEMKIGKDGDVEHFRPKKAVRIGQKLEYPGYYWLAYEWENLFWCCSACNQRHKRSHFPLSDESKRVRNHQGNIEDEEPLFIHPIHDRPEDLIGWNAEVPVAIDDNIKATATLRLLKIEQRHGNARKEHLSLVRKSFETWMILNDLATQHLNDSEIQRAITLAEQTLQEFQLPSAKFTGMVRAYLRTVGYTKNNGT
jgi:uncharacterized protein (TIGR02646 family)